MTTNDIALLNNPNPAINLIRFAIPPASSAHVAPARHQTKTPTTAVTIATTTATTITAYNATFLCIEHACRTKTKFACISAATMTGAAITSIHNALGVVACSSWTITISSKPGCEINNPVKQQPDSHHPVPVNSHRHDIDAMLHVVLAREDPNAEQHRFTREHQQMQHVHSEHEPHDRTICIAVPTKV